MKAQPTPPPIMARACSDTLERAVRPRAPVAMRWRSGAVSWGTWSIQAGTSRIPVDVIVARVNPTRVPLALTIERRGNAIGPWTIARAPANALIAFNAGQFTDEAPWGWVVHRGREWQAPGTGSLAAAIVVDSAQTVRIVSADSIGAWRADSARRRTVVEAIQSYPQLLRGARLPAAICRAGSVDRQHRDIRLALGVRSDGEVIVALTRYAPSSMPAAVAARLPIGPTTLEMAEIMHQLGSVDALLLDGGLSAQLLVGSGTGRRQWPGLRAVPLAIVGTPRQAK